MSASAAVAPVGLRVRRGVIHKSTGLPGLRAELSGQGNGLSIGPVSGNAPRPDAQRAVEMLAHFDPGAHKMRPQGRGRNPQPATAPQHGVVVADLARLLEAQDLVEVEVETADRELVAVGYRQTAFYGLQENTYLAVFAPANAPDRPASPEAIHPCLPAHS